MSFLLSDCSIQINILLCKFHSFNRICKTSRAEKQNSKLLQFVYQILVVFVPDFQLINIIAFLIDRTAFVSSIEFCEIKYENDEWNDAYDNIFSFYYRFPVSFIICFLVGICIEDSFR